MPAAHGNPLFQLEVFKVGIPWPSRSHLGSDLAQTFHAGIVLPMSCRAAHGAQVRLVMPTHQALDITVPSATKRWCAKSSSSTASQSIVALPRGAQLVLAQGEVTMPS